MAVNLMRGRPRLFGNQSEKFLKYYLDPLMSPSDICRLCDISLATFYNYEKELELPKLTVGIENYHTHLPDKKALQKFSKPGELFELKVLREIALRIQARIKLIPYSAEDANSALNAVKNKEVDFSVADLSWTKERSQQLYFSDTYKPSINPSGVLMRLKENSVLQSGLKPILGAPAGSVHLDYAQEHLQNEFKIKIYSNVEPLFRALLRHAIDVVILHPVWLEIFPEYTNHIEIVSKKIVYQSHTGVVFHSDSEHWRPQVNQAIADMLESWKKNSA